MSSVTLGSGSSQIPKKTEISKTETYATVDEGDNRKIESMGDAIEAWHDYLSAKEGRHLVLEGSGPDVEEPLALAIPHTHRWSPKYRREMYAKMKTVERVIGDVWGEGCPSTMITLTMPQKTSEGNPKPPLDVLEELQEAKSKLMKLMRKRLADLPVRYEYISVLEPHKSGYPHVHIAIFGVSLPSIGEELTEMWTEKYIEGAAKQAQSVDVSSRQRNLSNPAAYLMKYLGKTMSKSRGTDAVDAQPDISGYHRFSALLWISGARTVTMSRELRSDVSDRMESNKEIEEEEVEVNWKPVGTTGQLEMPEGGLLRGDKARKAIDSVSDGGVSESARGLSLDGLRYAPLGSDRRGVRAAGNR